MDERSAKRFIQMFGCDKARISSPTNERLYLILGWNRVSKGEWFKNGRPITFDYLEEKCVASGETMKELVASAKYYKDLCKRGWHAHKTIGPLLRKHKIRLPKQKATL